MRFHLANNDGYLTLSQLWEGDFTLSGFGEAARKLADEIAQAENGARNTRHSNWVIPYRRGLALFERLDKLRAEHSNK